MSYAYLFKFIIIGDTSVGKSCLLKRFIDGTYYGAHDTTIGVEFGSKFIKLNNKDIKLKLWDTAGQETFKSITRSYYRGCAGVILMYDITQRQTFNNITSWLNDIRPYIDKTIPIMLIGNKTDMNHKRQVERSDGEEFANLHNSLFTELSIKTQMNVDRVFYMLAEDLIEKINANKIKIDLDHGIKLGSNLINEVPKTTQNKCCYS